MGFFFLSLPLTSGLEAVPPATLSPEPGENCVGLDMLGALDRSALAEVLSPFWLGMPARAHAHHDCK